MVRAAMESIGKLSTSIGPSAVLDKMPNIVQWLSLILSRQAPYQQNNESFEESEEAFTTFTAILDTM